MLIIRLCRFGRTQNMSMLECFFSNRYDLLGWLSNWEDEKHRNKKYKYGFIFGGKCVQIG